MLSPQRKARIALLLVGVLGTAESASSHKDTALQLRPDGHVSGLPKEFDPVRIRVLGDPDEPRVSLHVRTQTVQLPSCIGSFFYPPTRESVRAKGSWYHERSTLPPYVSLLLPSESPAGFYSLLISLETAELLEFSHHGRRSDGSGMDITSIPVDSPCDSQDPLRVRSLTEDLPTSAIEVLE